MHRATDLPKKTPAPPEGSRSVSITSLGLVLFAVVAAASGQLMLKTGMQNATKHAHDTGGSLVIAAATSPWVIGGLAIFVISAMAWLGVLSRVPLSIAYPFNALGYIAILSASVVILHERATVMTWVGSLIVVTGLILVVLSKP
jgi:drug/metabolite transporter (DMT)-like permease